MDDYKRPCAPRDEASATDDEKSTRLSGDDFYCLRFRVWYPSIDCAYRTRYRTCPGCLDCDQGRFNLKRHEETLRLLRILPAAAGRG